MQIINGNSLEVLKGFEDNSIDSIVTDPPYGLSFMGKKWDYDVPSVEIWKECLRVLKPGGYLLAFAGTRTQHRMAVNIEDAGFEIRDMIAWCYGSGFPKSHNIGKAVDKLQGNERERVGETRIGKTSLGENSNWNTSDNMKAIKESGKVEITKGNSEWEGWGTALKPALEPITVARKPFKGTVAENCLKWGTGGINIDSCRVPTSYTDAYTGDGNSESIVPLHKLSELRHKAHILVSSFVADKKGYQTPANVKQYVQQWLTLKDYLGDCSTCLRLYDELSPLFQEDDQVSFQQLHDVHADIFRLHKEQSDSPSGLDTDLLSSLDDFVSLILSYSNYTTPDIKNARFPANFLHDGSEEVVELFPETAKSSGGRIGNKGSALNMMGQEYEKGDPGFGDSGSAARYFYCAKASKKDRNEGLDGFEEKDKEGKNFRPNHAEKAEQGEDGNPFGRWGKIQNNHPTVKPTKLMQYLVRLVTRKGGVVLDPFMGSGSTGKACKLEGMDFIGIELDPEYCKIAEARINAVKEELKLI